MRGRHSTGCFALQRKNPPCVRALITTLLADTRHWLAPTQLRVTRTCDRSILRQVSRPVTRIAWNTFQEIGRGIVFHGRDVRFDEWGQVSAYGLTGSGTPDCPAHLRYAKTHTNVPYFVLAYYRSRDDLLRAQDIVRRSL